MALPFLFPEVNDHRLKNEREEGLQKKAEPFRALPQGEMREIAG